MIGRACLAASLLFCSSLLAKPITVLDTYPASGVPELTYTGIDSFLTDP